MAVAALMAPAAIWRGQAVTWTLPLVITAFAVLYLTQIALLSAQRRPALPMTWLGGATATLAAAAALVTALSDPLVRAAEITVGEATIALCVLACGAVNAAVALASIALVGRRADRRITALALLLPVLLSSQMCGLMDAAHAVKSMSGVLLIAAAAASAALWVRRAPVRRSARESGPYQPALDMSGTAVAAVIAIAVLVGNRPSSGSSTSSAADTAVVLALCALALGAARVAVLLKAVTTWHDRQRVALTDDLTGLANRRAIQERLAAHLGPTGCGAMLLLMDLDRFQQTNDALGQAAGDQLLTEIGVRLVEAVSRGQRADQRGGLVIARHGNDEFAVLVAGEDCPSAMNLIGQIREALRAPFFLAGRFVHVSASIGAATAGRQALSVTDPAAQPSDATLAAVVPGEQAVEGRTARQLAAELVRRADTAMYAAKKSDTGVVIADEDDEREGRSSAAWLQAAEEVRTALRAEQLVLHYQPQICLAGGGLRGVEALVRWDHPERGLVPPGLFLPLVAELGLQEELTIWAVDTAVHQAAAWLRAGHDIPVSVNLSPDDLTTHLVTGVAALLMAAGLPPRNLVLEITETSVVRDPAGAAQVLSSLVELGVRISIDDYGTGYSSLTLLLALPVTELKIDKSFIDGIGVDERSEIVVAATVDLAHRLGMEVVAEGVETDAVLARVRALGCDISQGYLHSRPVPPEQLIAALTTDSRWHAATAAPVKATTTFATQLDAPALVSTPNLGRTSRHATS